MTGELEGSIFDILPALEIKTVVDMMLASIGLEVVVYEPFTSVGHQYLCLERKSRNGEVLCHVTNFFFTQFMTTRHIAAALVNTVDYFAWNGEQIKNPYLGCKSLEEVMIRMDLTCLNQP